MKTHPVEAELFHADGETKRQTNMTKFVVIFHDFSNAPKNGNLMISFKHYWLTT